ncbi:MAG: double zinc ribbon domain-containing protein [Armatimonadota bacterium]
MALRRLPVQLRSARDALLDLCFPPRCQGCQELKHHLICDDCRRAIDRIQPPLCARCGRPFDTVAHTADICGGCRQASPAFEVARAIGTHTGPLRRVIIAYKFQGRTRLAQPLAQMLSDYVTATDGPAAAALAEAEVIVPVPLHPNRRRWRGYDQAELLATDLGARLGLPVAAQAMARVKETQPQISLTPAQRRLNVRGAFQVRKPAAVAERSIMLLDDVLTTGATLQECAKVLKRAGAKRVLALTVSRSSPEWDAARDLF